MVHLRGLEPLFSAPATVNGLEDRSGYRCKVKQNNTGTSRMGVEPTYSRYIGCSTIELSLVPAIINLLVCCYAKGELGLTIYGVPFYLTKSNSKPYRDSYYPDSAILCWLVRRFLLITIYGILRMPS